jgi:DNA-directed RNA polymerase specialized sigma subunit
MRAVASSAAWEAECQYDSSRGVPFSGFARQRVLSSALTRYRQEWSYALRSAVESDIEGRDKVDGHEHLDVIVLSIRVALDHLPLSEAWLIRQLFWNERSEMDLARHAGITQQAISKRKQVILSSLRQFF